MSPKSSEQFANIRQKRKQDILDIALRLFAEQGYHSTSISKIAKQAKISKGLLYNYFDSKQALLEEIIQMVFQKLGHHYQNIFAYSGEGGKEEARQLLYEVVNSIRESLKQDKAFWKFYTRLGLQLGDQPHLLKKVYQIEDDWNISLRKMLERLEKPYKDEDVLHFNATLDGISLHYLFHYAEYPLDLVLDNFIKTYTT